MKESLEMCRNDHCLGMIDKIFINLRTFFGPSDLDFVIEKQNIKKHLHWINIAEDFCRNLEHIKTYDIIQNRKLLICNVIKLSWGVGVFVSDFHVYYLNISLIF